MIRMKKKYIEPFKQKDVNVAIPHKYQTDRLFYHSGKIVEITDTFLTLEKTGCYKQINLEDVIEIELKGGDND